MIDRAWFSRLLQHPARKQRVQSFNPLPTRHQGAEAHTGSFPPHEAATIPISQLWRHQCMFFHLLSQPTVPINTSLSSQHTSYRLQLIKGQKCHTAFLTMEADLLTFSTNVRPYGIPSCITHRPLPTYQISLRWEEKFFRKSPQVLVKFRVM